jgi:hypothetical protein
MQGAQLSPHLKDQPPSLVTLPFVQRKNELTQISHYFSQYNPQ